MSTAPTPEEKAWMLATLRDLAEAGMVLVRELTSEVKQADNPPADTALKFSRLARAVRQSVSLYGLVLEDGLTGKVAAPPPPAPPLEAWEKRGMTEAAWEAEALAEERANDTYDALEKAIDKVENPVERDTLLDALHERMEADLDDPAFLGPAPVAAVIAAICRELNFTPNWTAVEPSMFGLDERLLRQLRLGRHATPPEPMPADDNLAMAEGP